MSQTLNESLRQRRKAKGLTQEQLAEKVHVSRQTISNWENGRANPDYEMLKTLADLLESPLTELLGMEDESVQPAEEEPETPETAQQTTEPVPEQPEAPAEEKRERRFYWRMAAVFAATVVLMIAVHGLMDWWQHRPVPSPYPPEWFMQEMPVQENQAHIEMGVLESPIPLQQDQTKEWYRWNYSVYLRETNGIGFTIDSIVIYFFYADGGHMVEVMPENELDLSRLGRYLSGNTVNYFTAGDGGITLIQGRGYVLEATDDNGNHVEARCYVPYEQPEP